MLLINCLRIAQKDIKQAKLLIAENIIYHLK